MMKEEMELTLLSLDDINSLGVIKKYGKMAETTDLALATGALINEEYNSCYYLKDFHSDCHVYEVVNDGSLLGIECDIRSSIRPVLVVPNLDSLDFVNSSNTDKGIIVEYGEYPQEAASIVMQKRLESEYKTYTLNKTGNSYTFDDTICTKETPFHPVVYDEYEYNNKKYIRVRVNSLYSKVHLSNNEKYSNGECVWIEVKPVEWLVDYKAKKLVSSKVLLSGIRFCGEKTTGYSFDNSDIKEYLEQYMFPELFWQNKNLQIVVQTPKIKKRNPYGLNLDDVSEEDIIRGAIESNIPVFLHGPSSEGKSARVKQIDPTCEIIYLRNATPESLNGKSVYSAGTGEMIDIKPTWLKKLEDKCQNEPDKLHVLFFDELTNALPSIQGMAFNIVLDREVNGIWHLPENARIVAAGNEMDDSLAANQLAEPLFNRFAHVNIKTTPEKWLKWASLNNIHPAIYAYIAYKREKALRSKFDGKKPNADPRKWEMASKVLYQTGNPKMLRSLVGEEITQEFVQFCSEEVITLEDVINGNYTTEDIQKLDTAKRYATTMGLTMASEEHLEIVRNFTKKLGGEYRSVFDTLWTHNDESRLEKIAELEQENSSKGETNDNPVVEYNTNDDVELTLLSDYEAVGSKQLDVLKKYGEPLVITDLAILNGVNYQVFSRKFSKYYTKTASISNNVVIVGIGDTLTSDNPSIADYAIRPVLDSQSIFSSVYPDKYSVGKGIYCVSFGEYPQYVVSSDLQKKITNAHMTFRLETTGRKYTFNAIKPSEAKNKPFSPLECKEYEFEGRKYIHIEANPSKNTYTLSSDFIYKRGDMVWVEVIPIIWLVDEENKRLISKYGLLSGIRFDGSDTEYDGNFETTEMYKFMNEYMLKDILQSCETLEDVKKKIKK